MKYIISQPEIWKDYKSSQILALRDLRSATMRVLILTMLNCKSSFDVVFCSEKCLGNIVTLACVLLLWHRQNLFASILAKSQNFFQNAS